MRRSELVRAMDTVASAITESRVVDFLQMAAKRGIPEEERDLRHLGPMGMEIFHIFQRYAVAAHGFGPIETKIVEIFELQHLAAPDFWATLLFRGPRGPEQVHDYVENMSRGARILAAVRQLLAPEEIEVPTPLEGDSTRALERFSILVVEDRGRLSRPLRLVNVLQGVSLLYESHALLQSLPGDTLLVAACDSGSDKAFDFLGIAKAVQALKETILSLWDRVVFFRERKLLVNVRLVAESLPVLAEIAALAERNAIGPEQAELLRRQVIDGASQLVEAGAITPEISTPGHRDIRALAAPEPKLLMAPQLGAEPEQHEMPSPPKGKRRRKADA